MAPTYNADVRVEGDTLVAKLKPSSWNVIVTRLLKASLARVLPITTKI